MEAHERSTGGDPRDPGLRGAHHTLQTKLMRLQH